jgi:HD superfamily phosphohydrolase
MFQGKYHKKFFNQLISSQLDVDRLDYLNRDSFFTGVSEGNINTQRIISMMNVCSEGELVIDAKGVYSIENFLTARMFMYWQVYYHKTSALAEFLLVKILERAKYLISEGMDLPAGENLKYFLNRGKSSATDEDIYRFTQLDDNDIIHAMKSWQDSEDFILSYWCRCVIQRNLPKTVISTRPFKRKFIEEKIKNTNEFFGINNGKELVHEIKRKLLPYDTKKQPIYLLQKNGKKIRLEESQDQLLSGLMVHKTARYILTFPRDISHIIS